MSESIRVLHVDDDPNITELTASFLERADGDLEVVTATSATEGLEILERERIDCVVSDYQMPEMDGFEFLETVRERDPEMPFVLFTGKGSEEIASEAISAGVTDYLQKESGNTQYELLANRIVNAVGQYRPERQRMSRSPEYQAILEDVLGMYVVTRPADERVIEDCNDRFADRLGYDREELLDEPVSRVVAPGDDGDDISHRESDTSGSDGAWGECRLETADGETVPMRFRTCPWLDTDEDAVGTLAMFVEDSERQRLDARLDFYEEILDTVPDAIYALDDDMRYMFVNEGMAELTGYDREDIVGAHKSKVNTEESVESGRVKREDLKADRDDMKVAIHPHVTSEGETIPTEVRFSKLPLDEDEEFRGTAGVIRDITDRLERERQLERQNRRLDEFASVVSHDLRNPINVVEGRVELARQDAESDAVGTHLEKAQSELERMDALIDDVLSYARHGQEISDLEPLDLGTVAEAAWTAVGSDEGSIEVTDDVTIRANRIRLQRLAENLVRNAVEHVGDAVTVRVGTITGGFYVEDDGPGISDDRRQEVFEPGISTDHEGTGFGLAIVKTIAESHGWTIDLTEGANGGARFEFTDVDLVDTNGDRSTAETAEPHQD